MDTNSYYSSCPTSSNFLKIGDLYLINEEKEATSGQGTGRISTVHPKLLDNSIKDFVVTLLSIEELSGTTNFVEFVEGSLSKATKFEVLNSSIWVLVFESRCSVIGYPACLASAEYLNTGA
jgi:hypothetical protein